MPQRGRRESSRGWKAGKGPQQVRPGSRMAPRWGAEEAARSCLGRRGGAARRGGARGERSEPGSPAALSAAWSHRGGSDANLRCQRAAQSQSGCSRPGIRVPPAAAGAVRGMRDRRASPPPTCRPLQGAEGAEAPSPGVRPPAADSNTDGLRRGQSARGRGCDARDAGGQWEALPLGHVPTRLLFCFRGDGPAGRGGHWECRGAAAR